MNDTARTPDSWSVQDAHALYSLDHWGGGMFQIDRRGHLTLGPHGPDSASIDLAALADELIERGVDAPLLVRFPDVVQNRIEHMYGVFETAMREHDYRGAYSPVYPVKVNQQRHLLDELLDHGLAHGLGLEVGSAPELLAAMVSLDDADALLVVNGAKDARVIELAVVAQALGHRVILVLENEREVRVLLETHRRLGVAPLLGLRTRLGSAGTGRWEVSTGDRAKFGFSPQAMVRAVDALRNAGLLNRVELLHFHPGSQLGSIRSLKRALREARRTYVELCQLGAPLAYFDVGGGLAVDYGGGGSGGARSKNYTDLEYARDVVEALSSVCDEAGLAHPAIVTESGRALVAHTAMLVVEVIGVEPRLLSGSLPVCPESDDHPLIQALWETLQDLDAENYREALHDVIDAREQVRSAYDLGVMSLRQRAHAEELYWHCVARISRLAEKAGDSSPELGDLSHHLADTYFCNFSVFQSLPDSWAIDQLFPILPLARLNERPNRRATLADVTCDSDGRVDRFVLDGGVQHSLPLHEPDGNRYLLAIPLVGAYQEILGDMHNLFGDVNTVHVRVQPNGRARVERVIDGDTVGDVLGYAQFDRKTLIHRARKAVERGISDGRLSREAGAGAVRQIQQACDAYPYLVAATETAAETATDPATLRRVDG